MRVRTRLLGASLLVLGLISAAAASAATIAGRVRDANNNSYLLGATVIIAELDRTATTTSGGDYLFTGVPVGEYTVTVKYLGYDDSVQKVSVGAVTDTARVDFDLGAGVVKLGTFVVEGTREGQARALQQKRSANNIMDAVSADAVGKFPDGNAAEALRRIPGVSMEIDQGEGRFVVVRGIDAALNNVTLNGQSIGSPAEQGRRGLAMDSVPADLIQRLEVYKAVTPDLDHNAIGGSVNIVTQSPFDRDEPIFIGSLSTGYNDFSGDWGWYGGSVTYGRVLDEAKRWGIIAGASYSFREFESQTSDAIDWILLNGNYLPQSQESFDYHIERERLGANVGLEFRPSADTQLYVRVNHNEFTDDEGRQKTGYNFRLGTLTNQTPTSGANSQGRSTKEFRDYKQQGIIQALSVGGKHLLAGDYTLDWQLGASHGERRTPRRVDWEFRSAAGAFPNTYNLAGEIPMITPNAAFYDPNSYPFRRVRFRTDDEQEDVRSAQLDLRRDSSILGRSGFWKVGAKWLESEKTQDRRNINYNLASGAANLFTLGTSGLAGPAPEGFMRGRYSLGPTINLPALQAFFASNPQRFTYDANSSLDNSTTADFDGTEEVISAYAMASLQITPRSTLVAGLRAEHTDATYSGFEVRNGAAGRLTLSSDYTQWLPGIHFNSRINDRLVFRAAWTNTYGRTNYTDLAPRNSLEDIDLGGGVFEGSLSAGNPNLQPFESMNFDASLEYYLRNAGIVSVGAFHKIIDNPVYRNSYTLNNTTYNGRNYSRLSISRPENADSGEITGVEFNYNQYFSMLPSPFDGLGLNVNYTITDSSATIFGRSGDIPFFKQSDSIGNLALLYEKYGFEARIAYAFNSDYLESVGATANDDGYTTERKVWDAKVSYRIHPKARLFVEFLNINEEPLRSFHGVESRSTSLEIYSWNLNVGVNFNL
jgi:TonB-dependent receptor